MGVSASFLVASESELHEAFMTQVPVEMREVEKTFDSAPLNPFTGEPLPGAVVGPRTVHEYIPVGKPYAETRPPPVVPFWQRLLGMTPRPVDSFQHLPHIDLKYIDPVTAAQLHHALDNTDLNVALALIIDVMRPPHEPQDCGVQKLGTEFVAALAALDETQLSVVTNRWLDAEEVKFDENEAKQIIVELRGLAKTALQQDKGLYLAWSL